MPAELFLVCAEADAFHILLDDEAGDTLGPVVGGSRHRDIYLVGAAAGNELLGPVDDIMVAIADGLGLQRGGVRSRAGLGQAVAGDFLHRHQFGQIFVLHRLRSERIDHPGRHIVNRDKGAGRGTAIGHGFHDDRRFKPSEANAAGFLGHVNAAETELCCLLDRIARKDMLFIPFRRERRDRIGGKFLRHFLNGKLVFGQGKLGHIYFLFFAICAAVDSTPRITRKILPRAIFARSAAL